MTSIGAKEEENPESKGTAGEGEATTAEETGRECEKVTKGTEEIEAEEEETTEIGIEEGKEERLRSLTLPWEEPFDRINTSEAGSAVGTGGGLATRGFSMEIPCKARADLAMANSASNSERPEEATEQSDL